MKSKNTAIICSIFGVHYIYLNQIGLFVLFFFTYGGFFIWWIFDVVRLCTMSDDEFNAKYNSGDEQAYAPVAASSSVTPRHCHTHNENKNIISINNGERSCAEELLKYHELLLAGALTQEEFDIQKSKLLNR